MHSKELIKALFSQPTAPFKEHFVLNSIKSILLKKQIPFFQDVSGNIIAGVSNPKKIWNKNYLVYVAHTDHPGFHITGNMTKNKYSAKWFGGAPFKQMKGKSVSIYSADHAKTIKGKILSIDHKVYKRSGMDLVIESKGKSLGMDSFGGFHFGGYQFKNNLVVTRAADDLAGCVMALGSLVDICTQKKPVLAIFTRAEEVGFIGCLGLIKSKILNTKYAHIISLEASKTLPGALVHEGPVVRLGDASSIFNSHFNRFMILTAQNLMKTDRKFKFQKRLMDGGSCEATAFDVHGYTTMGISVPLLNYHNQGKRGPAPEMISIFDIENGRKLLVAIAENFKSLDSGTQTVHKNLHRQYLELKSYLKTDRDQDASPN